MKKRFASLLFLASLTIVATAIVLCACSKEDIIYDNSPCYDLSASIEGNVLKGSEEILYTAKADSDRVILRTYANAFAPQNDAIDILSAKIDRSSVEFEVYGDDKTLLWLKRAVKEGESYIININYTITLPKGNARLGINEDGNINLSCFYPVLAMYDGVWREDVFCNYGDPFYFDCSSFYVNLTIPDDLEVATGGCMELISENNGTKTVEIAAECVRDFAIVIGKLQCANADADIGGKRVTVDYKYIYDRDAEATLARACKVLEVFSEHFGEYPYSTFGLCESDIGEAGGMEYGGFAIVAPSSQENYLDVVTHEIAHQWWYNAVGNDQLTDAWLDEGLAEFCTYYYYELTGERQTFAAKMAEISRSYGAFAALKPGVGFDNSMHRHLTSFISDGEYVAVAYLKGALLFDTLRTLAGDRKFEDALRAYYDANKFKIATATQLADAFSTQGINTESLIESWLNGSAV